ncbi:hypothetical protein GCM10022236_45610 [Microlunatus ginsengisoli]|uniref:Uncharacterized protein n=1 Tax=Microlunatus ginsengisoli TaxID=363863 RepID=A0ABP7AR94_9ACTN
MERGQAGWLIPSGDGLYKQMVPERPATYDAADAALRRDAGTEAGGVVSVQRPLR